MEHVQLLYEVSALSGDKEVKNLKKNTKKTVEQPFKESLENTN